MILVDACDLHARGHAQSLRNARGSRAPNVFLRDDKDRRGYSLDLLRLLGNTGDLQVAELFETELFECLIGVLSGLGFVGPSERDPGGY